MIKNFINRYPLPIVLAIGAILRTVHIGGRSFWVDEGLTAALVGVSIPEMIGGCAVNSNPPLFYLCLWPWSRIFGVNEISFGAFAAILGILTILYVYKLTLYISDNKTAFLAALITALSPFMVYASNDSRPYCFLGLVTIMAVYYFLLAINENKLKYWIYTGIFTTASAYTHLLGWSVLLLEVSYIVFSGKFKDIKILKRAGITWVGVFLLYLPQLTTTLNQFKILKMDEFSPVSESSGGILRVILVAIKQFLGGFYRILADYYFMDLGGSDLKEIHGLEFILFILTLIFAFGTPILILIFLFKHKPKWGLFLILMYLTPFAQVFHEGTDPRRFTPPASAMYILMAMTYFSWKRPVRIIYLVLFIAISGLSLQKAYSLSYSIFKKEDYRSASKIIAAQRKQDDRIVFHGGSCGNLNWQYYDPGGTIFGAPDYYPNNFYIYPMVPPEEVFSEKMFPAAMDTLLDGSNSVWMVISNKYPPNIIPLAEKWDSKYNIDIEYTDYYLTLFKISRTKKEFLQDADEIMNSNEVE